MHADYAKYLDTVGQLSFVEGPQAADSKVKAVLGVIASRLEDPYARKLVDCLPNPLTYEKLVGHRMTITDLTPQQFIRDIADQFRLNEGQAQLLIDTVLAVAKEDIDDQTLREIEDSLPEEWAELISEA